MIKTQDPRVSSQTSCQPFRTQPSLGYVCSGPGARTLFYKGSGSKSFRLCVRWPHSYDFSTLPLQGKQPKHKLSGLFLVVPMKLYLPNKLRTGLDTQAVMSFPNAGPAASGLREASPHCTDTHVPRLRDPSFQSAAWRKCRAAELSQEPSEEAFRVTNFIIISFLT